jgi:hypothetical protein
MSRSKQIANGTWPKTWALVWVSVLASVTAGCASENVDSGPTGRLDPYGTQKGPQRNLKTFEWVLEVQAYEDMTKGQTLDQRLVSNLGLGMYPKNVLLVTYNVVMKVTVDCGDTEDGAAAKFVGVATPVTTFRVEPTPWVNGKASGSGKILGESAGVELTPGSIEGLDCKANIARSTPTEIVLNTQFDLDKKPITITFPAGVLGAKKRITHKIGNELAGHVAMQYVFKPYCKCIKLTEKQKKTGSINGNPIPAGSDFWQTEEMTVKLEKIDHKLTQPIVNGRKTTVGKWRYKYGTKSPGSGGKGSLKQK